MNSLTFSGKGGLAHSPPTPPQEQTHVFQETNQRGHLYFSFIFVFPTAPLHLLLLSSLLLYFSLNFSEKPGSWFGLLSLGFHLSDHLNTFCGSFFFI